MSGGNKAYMDIFRKLVDLSGMQSALRKSSICRNNGNHEQTHQHSSHLIIQCHIH